MRRGIAWRLLAGLALILLGGYMVAIAASPVSYALAGLGVAVSIAGFVVLGRSRGFRPTRRRFTVALDPVAVVLDAVFLLSVLFGSLAGLLGNDQASQNLGQFLIGMQLSAMVMAFLTGSMSLRVSVGGGRFRNQLVFIMATLAAYFVLNLLVPPTLPVFFQSQSLATSGRFVTDIISIPEESLFRGWLAPWLANLSQTGIAGGAVSSALLFMVYHLFVYGTQPSKLFIVFGAGLVAGFTALKTQLQSSTMVPHFVNNFISTGGF